jgi:cytochrome c551
MEKIMKTQKFVKGMLLVGAALFAGTAMAEGTAEIGKAIYDRAFGRGCATCHDVKPNPNLFESANKLSRDDFKAVLVNGRGAMPKAMDAIMAVGPVKKNNLSEDQAVDDLIEFLKSGGK